MLNCGEGFCKDAKVMTGSNTEFSEFGFNIEETPRNADPDVIATSTRLLIFLFTFQNGKNL